MGEEKPIDIGAEQLLAAENNDRKIAVDFKSAIGESIIADLEPALGQYTLYCDILKWTASRGGDKDSQELDRM
ncbi:element excision factor XisH family protein [Microcoleus sp. F8-D3]